MKLDIKTDKNTSKMIVYGLAISLGFIAFSVFLIAQPTLITVEIYQNCTQESSKLLVPDWDIGTDKQIGVTPNLFFDCCFPAECGIPCEYPESSCIYPVQCGTLEELGFK